MSLMPTNAQKEYARGMGDGAKLAKLSKPKDESVRALKALKVAIKLIREQRREILNLQTMTDGRIRRLEDKHKRHIQELNDRMQRLEDTYLHRDRKEQS